MDAQEFLLWMFAATFGGNGSNRAFDELEEGLLNAFARNIACNRRIGALAGNLVNFVDVDDTSGRAVDVPIGCMQQIENDIFDVITDVSGFGQAGGICHGKGHIEDFSECLSEQGFAGTGGPDEENVGFA